MLNNYLSLKNDDRYLNPLEPLDVSLNNRLNPNPVEWLSNLKANKSWVNIPDRLNINTLMLEPSE